MPDIKIALFSNSTRMNLATSDHTYDCIMQKSLHEGDIVFLHDQEDKTIWGVYVVTGEAVELSSPEKGIQRGDNMERYNKYEIPIDNFTIFRRPRSTATIMSAIGVEEPKGTGNVSGKVYSMRSPWYLSSSSKESADLRSYFTTWADQLCLLD